MHCATTLFDSPYGSLELARYPARPDEPLQAWCAADSLLLEAVHAQALTGPDILVVNDAHGALSVALTPLALWTDSALSVAALRANEVTNNRPQTATVWSTQEPPVTQLVVLRVPKQLSYFEYQLSRLATLLPTNATVFAAGMDKHLSSQTADILERFIGPTQRHRGRHKARLFTAVRDESPPLPVDDHKRYFCDPLDDTLRSLPNVFSAQALDRGSRLLLAHLGSLAPAERLIDLACGNGVLGLVAHHRGLARSVSFCDESAMAVASARLNAEQRLAVADSAHSFHHGDGLADYQGEAAQLILCNPPFHMDHTVDEFAGTRLVTQCAPHLEPGGRLCLVANRHLDYRSVLKASFAKVEKLAANAKFNLLLAHAR